MIFQERKIKGERKRGKAGILHPRVLLGLRSIFEDFFIPVKAILASRKKGSLFLPLVNFL